MSIAKTAITTNQVLMILGASTQYQKPLNRVMGRVARVVGIMSLVRTFLPDGPERDLALADFTNYLEQTNAKILKIGAMFDITKVIAGTYFSPSYKQRGVVDDVLKELGNQDVLTQHMTLWAKLPNLEALVNERISKFSYLVRNTSWVDTLISVNSQDVTKDNATLTLQHTSSANTDEIMASRLQDVFGVRDLGLGAPKDVYIMVALTPSIVDENDEVGALMKSLAKPVATSKAATAILVEHLLPVRTPLSAAHTAVGGQIAKLITELTALQGLQVKARELEKAAKVARELREAEEAFAALDPKVQKAMKVLFKVNT